jgi:5-methylcytosine-specific restriction endonuclease McrA
MPARTVPLQRGQALERHTELERRTRLKARSPKTERKYRVRRVLVATLLEDRPWCEIRWDDRCQGRAVDVDEVLSRGRGGDYCDPDNCQTACRPCHAAKHNYPIEAVSRQVALKSWDGGAA